MSDTTARRTPLVSWSPDRGVSARIPTAVGIVGLMATNAAATDLYKSNVTSTLRATAMRQAMLNMRIQTANQALEAEAAQFDAFEQGAREYEATARELLAEFRTVASGAEAELLDEFERGLDVYAAGRDNQCSRSAGPGSARRTAWRGTTWKRRSTR